MPCLWKVDKSKCGRGAQTDVGKQAGMWENGRQITTEYAKLMSLLCFVNEFPKTKRRK